MIFEMAKALGDLLLNLLILNAHFPMAAHEFGHLIVGLLAMLGLRNDPRFQIRPLRFTLGLPEPTKRYGIALNFLWKVCGEVQFSDEERWPPAWRIAYCLAGVGAQIAACVIGAAYYYSHALDERLSSLAFLGLFFGLFFAFYNWIPFKTTRQGRPCYSDGAEIVIAINGLNRDTYCPWGNRVYNWWHEQR